MESLVRGYIRKFVIPLVSRRAQAAVETAIIMPLMVFMLLGIVQLTLIQQARLMTEHAAFNAARAGIVWNASQDKMVNAASVTLVPALPIVKKGDFLGSLVSFAKWALVIKGSQYADKGIASLEGLGKMLNINVGGIPDVSVVQVTVINPRDGNWDKIPDVIKVGGKDGKELDFDYVPSDATTTDAKNIREVNRLTIRTRFLYPMRIPFANYIIHTAWMAQAAGVELTGPIDKPMMKGQLWNEQSRARQTIEGRLPQVDPTQILFGDKDKNTLKALWELNKRGLYLIPLRATYSMRMQSNIFRDNLKEGFF